jgi:hypothetical protein
MTKVLAAALAVASCAVGGFLITPASLAAQPPPVAEDTVAVSGDGGFFSNISIDARSGPSGENPTGTASFVIFGTIHLVGPVTCLNVLDNTAVLNFRDSTFGLGTVSLTDNGGSGTDIMELAFEREPTDCSPVSVGSFTSTLRDGRAVVVDAPPLPQTKDQCKNDGWRQYGFQHQGQCVAFVERGPKS